MRWSVATACLWMLTATAAVASAPCLRIDAPATLITGARLSLAVHVSVPPQASARPLVLTAHATGRALDVVRGRLLRSDARAPNESADTIVFDVRVVAATAGVAILKVSLLTYVCEQRCQAVRQDATQQILVRDP